MEQEKTFKMIIIGAAGVGKSCLLNRLTRNEYNDGYTATLGVEFYSKEMNVGGIPIKIQVWDTAGQQSFRSIVKTFYRSSAAVFLVYSIASLASFKDLEYWYAEAIQNSSSEAVFALIGTQKDRGQEREVTYEMAEAFMLDKDLAFMYETSAKTSENVGLVFTQAAKLILRKQIYLKNQNKLNQSLVKKKCQC